MDEINLNFRSKQATLYSNGQLVASFMGDDFTQFDGVLAIAEASLVKTPEKIEAEKLAQIAELEASISRLTAQKEALVKNEPIKEDI